MSHGQVVPARPDEELLDPTRTALVVFDLLEHYRAAAEEAGVIGPVRRLVDGCRSRGAMVAWARADHRADGADFARTLADVDNQHRPFGVDNPRPVGPPYGSGSPMYHTLTELGQRPDDYDVPKHRWSAFHGTHLDTSLRARGRTPSSSSAARPTSGSRRPCTPPATWTTRSW